MTDFRCAAASLSRGEDVAGTASTVRSFLLVEHPGPWGVDALRDARLPDRLGQRLARAGREHGVRVLLVRRHGRRAERGTRVFGARVAGPGSWLESTVLDDVGEVGDLDLAPLGTGRSLGLAPHEDPLVLVCTHGRHDACCAEQGRPVAAALDDSPYAGTAWECSHIGGDRFAGNVLVLPRGLYYGRVEPSSAVAIARATAEGRVVLDHLRGRSDLPMPAQAAEIDVRRRLGLTGLDDVRVVSWQRAGDLTSVVLEAESRTIEVTVRRVLEPEQRLACNARRDNPVPRFEVEVEVEAGS